MVEVVVGTSKTELSFPKLMVSGKTIILATNRTPEGEFIGVQMSSNGPDNVGYFSETWSPNFVDMECSLTLKNIK